MRTKKEILDEFDGAMEQAGIAGEASTVIERIKLEVMVDTRDAFMREEIIITGEPIESPLGIPSNFMKPEECTVILNGRPAKFVSDHGEITYEAILKYLGWTNEKLLTVTWHRKGTEFHGEITRGEAIPMHDDLIINAMDTSNA